MRLNGYKCDACGKFYERNEEKDKNGLPATGIGILNIKLGITRYDLCDECLKKVQDIVFPTNNPEDV